MNEETEMRFRQLAPILIIISMAACTATSPTKTESNQRQAVTNQSKTAEEIVAHNAKARWDAIIAKDFDAAFEYLTPGTRATTSLDAYTRRMLNVSVRYVGAEVESVSCEGEEVCTATLMITYKVRGASPGTGDVEGFSPTHEQWLLSAGQWFHLPEKTGR